MRFFRWLHSKFPFFSQIAVGLIIMAISALVGYLLILNKPEVQREERGSFSTLVEVITVEPKEEQVVIDAFGTIQGNRQVTVFPEVSGRVVEQSEDLVVGGLLGQGEVMLKIDPRDYITVVEQEEAGVKRAEFELKLEQGKRIVAEREWELLGPTIEGSELGKQLALREPQLEEKRAALEAAKSRLEKAKNDLERTILRSPFNAIVTQEFTEVGQLINMQSAVATLVSTDEFRVQVSIPYELLKWIQIPRGNRKESSDVFVIQELGNGEAVTKKGEIQRLLGDVDPSGRMTRLLVKIPDPLGLEGKEVEPFLIGTYVRVDIYGPVLKDVFVLPREAIREGNQVWIKNGENQLEMRTIKIGFRTADRVFITQGLEKGDQVIISPLPVALPGMQLREE